MASDVDSVLRRIDQFGPFQIRVLAMFFFHIPSHHLPNTYHGVCSVRAAMDVHPAKCCVS